MAIAPYLRRERNTMKRVFLRLLFIALAVVFTGLVKQATSVPTLATDKPCLMKGVAYAANNSDGVIEGSPQDDDAEPACPYQQLSKSEPVIGSQL